MAVSIHLILYTSDAAAANRAADAVFAEFGRLNAIFSDYDATSESRRLCERARVNQPERVSNDLFRVLAASKELSGESRGAFDVTAGPLTRLWRRTLRRRVLPSRERLEKARASVGHQHFRLDSKRKTVTLLKPDMRLDFGGIAKGYALDKGLEVLRKRGITRALINASGDIRVGDPPPGKKGWRIAVAQLDKDRPPLHFISLRNAAVATSGDTWQFVEIEGRRYSHIIDPRTGIALTDHSSVTIIAPTAMQADALASGVSVLGPIEGMKLIERTPGVAALIVRPEKGKPKVFRSRRFNCHAPKPSRAREEPVHTSPKPNRARKEAAHTSPKPNRARKEAANTPQRQPQTETCK
jgi:thiamine biosynthesis lipoprotein